MLDKTLISIISMIFGSVGLIGAITKYDFPRARKTTYGENLFLLKENIINNVLVWFFTIYAMIGLTLQIFLGEILEFEERLHNTSFYFIAFVFALFLIASLIPVMKRMSKWFARTYWLPEISQKAKDVFLLAKSLVDQNSPDEGGLKRAVEIANWLEELFEMKSNKQDLASRLQFFENTFNQK